MRDAKLLLSNEAGWIGLKQSALNEKFVALYIGKSGEEGRRVGVFDYEGRFTSEENAAAFARHLFALVKKERA